MSVRERGRFIFSTEFSRAMRFRYGRGSLVGKWENHSRLTTVKQILLLDSISA